MRRKPFFWVALFVLACSGLALYSGASYRYWSGNQPGPGFFPMWLGAVLAVLSVLFLISAVRSETAGAFNWPDKRGLRRLLTIIGAQAGFVLLVSEIGFLAASTLFLFILFVIFTKYKIWANALLSVTLALAFFLLFNKWLGVQLPTGFLGF